MVKKEVKIDKFIKCKNKGYQMDDDCIVTICVGCDIAYYNVLDYNSN